MVIPGPWLMRSGAMALPLLVAAVLASYGVVYRPPPDQWGVQLRIVSVPDMQQAEALFERLDFAWPPNGDVRVPRVAVDVLPPDLAAAGEDMSRKKAVFIRMLLPIVLAENERIRMQRTYLETRLASGLPEPGSPARRALRELLREYRVEGVLDQPETRRELLLRLDEIPTGLVLAQAANESGWGSSRFAQVANNLFGVWTFRDGMGLVPEARGEAERHTVRLYPSIRASVRSYMHNLNIGHAYAEFRERRAQMRRAGEALDSAALAPTLTRYSARGADYVRDIQAIIRANRLHWLDGVELRGTRVQLVDETIKGDAAKGG